MTPSLDIVIVNWNAGRQLETVLRSIAGARASSFTLASVVIVDNGSTDNSLELPPLDLPIQVIRNSTNRGFAAACNQGARAGTGDVVLLLNPDTELEPSSLSAPLAWLGSPSRERVGIVGIQLIDDAGHVARSCARSPQPHHFWIKVLGLDRLWPARFQSHVMDEWPHDSTREVDHVIGAFYMVRRQLWTALSGMDERFFVYLEDVDFSTRARQAGWSVVFLAEARARHTGGGTSAQVKPLRLALALESRLRYGLKHFPAIHAMALTGGTFVIEPWLRVVDALRRGQLSQVRETLAGYTILWRRWLGLQAR